MKLFKFASEREGTQKGGFPQKMGVGGGGGGGSNSRGNYVLPLLNSAESNENIRSNYSKGNPNLIIDISAPHFKVFNMMSNYFLLNYNYFLSCMNRI